MRLSRAETGPLDASDLGSLLLSRGPRSGPAAGSACSLVTVPRFDARGSTRIVRRETGDSREQGAPLRGSSTVTQTPGLDDQLVSEHHSVGFRSGLPGRSRRRQHRVPRSRQLRSLGSPDDLLVPRIWQLRENFSAYDATYVALAEGLADEPVPLLTAGPRMARAVAAHADAPVLLAA